MYNSLRSRVVNNVVYGGKRVVFEDHPPAPQASYAPSPESHGFNAKKKSATDRLFQLVFTFRLNIFDKRFVMDVFNYYVRKGKISSKQKRAMVKLLRSSRYRKQREASIRMLKG